MRTSMIVGNWKMNTTIDEAEALARKICSNGDLVATRNVEKIICPPFISLAAVKEIIKYSQVKLGAQNLHFETKGAYTGEISPVMLRGLCEFVIIGHSERRQYFGETSDVVGKKINAALLANLKPILCIGENAEEHKAGKTNEVISEQLKPLPDLASFANLTIAYEPIWAIGTGQAATGEEANDTIGYIRHCLTSLFGEAMSRKTRILYGGSVTADNIADIMKQPEIDGALVGGASLGADQFLNIIKRTSGIWKLSRS